MNNDIECRHTSATDTERHAGQMVVELESETEWCSDGTYVADGHPVIDHDWRTGISPIPGGLH